MIDEQPWDAGRIAELRRMAAIGATDNYDLAWRRETSRSSVLSLLDELERVRSERDEMPDQQTEAVQDAAQPDLSKLPHDVRMRISVARTQGWMWKRTEGTTSSIADTPRWVLSLEDGGKPFAMWDSGEVWAPAFPDYLTDPAAWGALMERERIAVEPCPDNGWQAAAGFYGERIGQALCDCVLSKYGIGVEP